MSDVEQNRFWADVQAIANLNDYTLSSVACRHLIEMPNVAELLGLMRQHQDGLITTAELLMSLASWWRDNQPR